MKLLFRLLLAIQALCRKCGPCLFLRWLSLTRPCSHTKTVLVLRPDALGDFLVSLSAIQQLHAHFSSQGYKIVVVHTATTKAIVSGCPFIDDAICIDRQRFEQNGQYRRTIARLLWDLHPEYTVNLLALPKQATLDHLLAFFSHAKHTCAINPASLRNRRTVCMDYSSPVGSPVKKLLRAVLPNQARTEVLLDSWCTSWKKLYDIFPDATATSDIFDIEQTLVNAICKTNASPKCIFPDWIQSSPELSLPKSYYVVATTAALHAKCWPEESFAHVILELHKQYPELAVVLTGTDGDRPTIERIQAMLTPSMTCLSLCGKTSLPQLFTIIRNACFLLGNDTGSAHIAGIAGKKSLYADCGRTLEHLFPKSSLYRNRSPARRPSLLQLQFPLSWSDTGRPIPMSGYHQP